MLFGRKNKDATGGETATPKPVVDENTKRVHVHYVGQVQGVGFRWTCKNCATRLGLTGWVRNEYDGSVNLELQGPEEAIAQFFTALVMSYKDYPIHYHMEDKYDMPVDPKEDRFGVRF